MDMRSAYRIAKSDPTRTAKVINAPEVEGRFDVVIVSVEPITCASCGGYGIVTEPDVENGPEFDHLEYCSCAAGERRRNSDIAPNV
jgi:hypothetical protein